MRATEQAHLTAQTADERLQSLIVGVEDGDILRSLIGKDLRLGREISFHVAMAIEVVGGEVQEEADVGTPPDRGEVLELKAGKFQHHWIAGCDGSELGEE